MINIAIQTIRKHGLRRVARTCLDITKAHGLFRGLIVIVRSLAARRVVSELGAMPALRPSVEVPCWLPGNRLFGRAVLFVAAMDLPQCKKYRVIQREEMLKSCGGMTVMHSEYRDILRWRSLLQVAGVVYAYRVPDGEEWRQLLRECNRLGIDVIYDIDDPVFDLDVLSRNPNLSTLTPAIRGQLAADANRFLAAMKQATRICVSTARLAEIAKQAVPGVPVHVVPNGIDSESWLHAQAPRKVALSGHDVPRPVNILVSSGSLAHDADFEVCRDGLCDLMRLRNDVVITVCGHADARGICESSRLTQYPMLPYGQYLQLVAAADLTLVPLCSCEFNEAKSCVRFLDAAISTTTVIASDVGEYRDLVRQGVCIGVTSDEGWFGALCKAVDTVTGPNEVAARAYRYVANERRLPAIWQRLDSDLLEALGTDLFSNKVKQPAAATGDKPIPLTTREKHRAACES